MKRLLLLLILIGYSTCLSTDFYQINQDKLRDDIKKVFKDHYLFDGCINLTGFTLIRLKNKIWDNPKDSRNIVDSIKSIVSKYLPLSNSIYRLEFHVAMEGLLANIEIKNTIITLDYDFEARKKVVMINRKIRQGYSDRNEFAKNLEFTFLDKHDMDTKINIVGNGGRTLSIEWILMNRVWAHKFMKYQDIVTISTLQNLGFHSIKFTDGYNYSVSYIIKP